MAPRAPWRFSFPQAFGGSALRDRRTDGASSCGTCFREVLRLVLGGLRLLPKSLEVEDVRLILSEPEKVE